MRSQPSRDVSTSGPAAQDCAAAPIDSPSARSDRFYGEDMTDQSPAVIVAHPPEAMLRAINPMLRFLLRTPLMGPMRKAMMVLSFTGRKSGRRYSVPVSAHQLDGELYALAGAAWRLNFRGGASAEVLHAGTSTTMQGELIEDAATVGELSRRVAEGYGVKGAQRMMGLKFRDQRIPTTEEFTEAARTNHIGAVRFTITTK
jgi:hypothetical protein